MARAFTAYAVAMAKSPEDLQARLEQIRKEIEGLGPKETPMEAALLHQAGEASFKLKDYETARLSLERAVELDRQVYGPDHPEIARGLNDLALVLRAMGRAEEAAQALSDSVRLYQKINGPGHPTVARGFHNLGRALLSQADLVGARESLEKALWIKQKALGEHHPSVRPTAQVLGFAAFTMKDLAAARTSFETSWRISERHKGHNHPDTCLDRHLLGRMEEDQGNLDVAREHFAEIVKLYKETGADSAGLGRALASLGRVQGRLGEAESVQTLKMAVAMGETGAGGLSALHNLGVALWNTGQRQEGVKHLKKAFAQAQKQLGNDHPRTRFYRKNAQRAIKALGQKVASG